VDIEHTVVTAANVVAAWAPRIIGVLVTLAVAWLLAKWARRALVRSLTRTKVDQTLVVFSGDLLRYAIIVGAVIGCLGIFGIETASFAAVIAALGLAIGLAFQGTLSNFAAGIMLLLFRPFRLGDSVTVAGVSGKVKEIDLFTTELTTSDNRLLIVPNSKIFGDTIENSSFYTERQIEVITRVAYGADLEQTRQVLESAVQQVTGTLSEPSPSISLVRVGTSSVEWKVQVWTKNSETGAVQQRLYAAVKTALDSANMTVPQHRLDVRIDESKGRLSERPAISSVQPRKETG